MRERRGQTTDVRVEAGSLGADRDRGIHAVRHLRAGKDGAGGAPVPGREIDGVDDDVVVVVAVGHDGHARGCYWRGGRPARPPAPAPTRSAASTRPSPLP